MVWLPFISTTHSDPMLSSVTEAIKKELVKVDDAKYHTLKPWMYYLNVSDMHNIHLKPYRVCVVHIASSLNGSPTSLVHWTNTNSHLDLTHLL